MANTITHKRSSTSSETPSASDLSAGEIAINTADAKLFIKKSDDSIATFSTSPSANQSGIVSILNTNLIVGRNTYDMIDFGTPNTIIFKAGNANQIQLYDGSIRPITDNDVDLGASDKEFKNLYLDGTAYVDAISAGGGITFETGTSGINIGSSSNNDVTIIRTGNDATQYGFNIKYMGSRTGTANSLSVFSDNSTGGLASRECITIYQDGKVGINWATPTYNLHVSGTGRISEDLSVGDDLSLASDSAVLNFGSDSDVSLTHVADTGLLLNSTRQLQFGDSGTYIHQSADGVLDLVSDTEIEINATTIDMNGALDVSGDIDVGGNIELGHASDTTISRASAGVMAVEGNEVLTSSTGATKGFATAMAIAL